MQGQNLVSIGTDSPYTKTVVGDTNVNAAFGGMAYDPNGGTMYLVTGIDRNNPGSGLDYYLYTVNTATAAASAVGAYGMQGLVGLAYDSTNSVLYASKQLSGATDLYTLNVSSGAPTHLGSMTQGFDGLAYDSQRDRLVGVTTGHKLYEINRTTLALTYIGTITGSSTDNAGLAYDSTKDLYWESLWFQSSSLKAYDPDTGTTTTHGSGISSITGLAFAAGAAVPEPSAACLLGLGLVALGCGRGRRKAAQSSACGHETAPNSAGDNPAV